MIKKRDNVKNNYARLTVRDFDRFDCVTISKGVYLILAFILRGYLIWIISVTNMNDRVAIIEWLYPQKAMFYLSLCSGALGLFIVLIFSLRRPNAALWVQWCWHHCRYFIISALLFDLIVSLVGYIRYELLSFHWLVLQAIVVLLAIMFLFTNRKFQLNLREFPEQINSN